MMGLKWVTEFCPKSNHYFFVDDDQYVSTRNLLAFLKSPRTYPNPIEAKSTDESTLFAGFVMQTPPHRHRPSKWFVSLDDYAFHLWPPYVNGGAYALSGESAKSLYYASYFVKTIKFEDIFLGLIAYKIGLQPLHCGEFYFDRKPFYRKDDYKNVVASQGFDDPEDLRKMWIQQSAMGNA